MLQIEEPKPPRHFALFNLGFRPFFLAGSLFSLLAISLWAAIQSLGWALPMADLPALYWHAHEMIFGYAMAVIAGFLLTSVRNWTGLSTPSGFPLAMLLLSWLLARLMPFTGLEQALTLMAVFDGLFSLALILSVTIPVVRVKQWRQLGIILALILLLLSNVLFYAGLMGELVQGTRWGLYCGLYLVVAMILILARRVIPFFIERGIGYKMEAKNYSWVDRSSVALFALFIPLDVFTQQTQATGLLATLLCVLHSIRLIGWYPKGIWQKPLLWILYIGYGVLALGFALKASAIFLGTSPFLSVHAFAFGGIGMITVGMMTRVALGHTGRNINSPPKAIFVIYGLLMAGTATRVLAPLILPSLFSIWLWASQLLWIAAFGLFIFVYLPILCLPRADGKPG